MINELMRRRAMMANATNNGLFAYWDEVDAPINNTHWVDRINGLNLILSNSSIYSNSSYHIPNGQSIKLNDDIKSFIEYELMVEIGYDIKLVSSSLGFYKAIDFGSLGSCKWNYGFLIGEEKTNSQIVLNAKDSANQLKATNTVYGSFSANTWYYNRICKGGIRLLPNGYQQVWAKINDYDEVHTTTDLQAVKLEPVPTQNVAANGYFNLGSSASALSIDQEVVIHYVKLYSKSV